MSVRPVLEVCGLRYSYDGRRMALDGVDFQLLPGETVALLGANGSGKSTFLLHLSGLLEGEGSIEVCGLPVIPANYVQVRRLVGLLFQNPDEQMFLSSVLADVSFGPLQAGCGEEEAARRAAEALRQAGLVEGWERAPYHLSAGEKQRAALAGVLAMEPRILALDEPTTHLDPPARKAFINLLRALPQAKLLVTHDTSLALELASRAVFFEAGKINSNGPVTEILARYGWT